MYVTLPCNFYILYEKLKICIHFHHHLFHTFQGFLLYNPKLSNTRKTRSENMKCLHCKIQETFYFGTENFLKFVCIGTEIF